MEETEPQKETSTKETEQCTSDEPKGLKDWASVLLSLLFWKSAIIFFGFWLAAANQYARPEDLAGLPENASFETVSIARAGGFAFITAVALAAGAIPTGKATSDKLVTGAASLLGIVAACGGGWHALEAIGGNPTLYVQRIAALAALTILTLALGWGFWALLGAGLVSAAVGLKAAYDHARRFVADRLLRCKP